MKFRSLDGRGVTHDFLIVAFIVLFAVFGVGTLVADHANNVSPGGSYIYLGQAYVPKQNETVKAYGCKLDAGAGVWQVNGFFSLSAAYRSPTTWQAFVTNTDPKPYPGHVMTRGYFANTASPTASVTTNVYDNAANSLQFTYSAGPDATGTVAANVHADHLPTCSKN